MKLFFRNRKFFKIMVVSVCCCAVVLTAAFIDASDRQVLARTAEFHVVLDAGHGGKDGGAVSSSGTRESDITLNIVKYLAKELDAHDIGVTLTRQDENSLASPFARNKKNSDMRAREEIINKVKPDLVVSIHLNNFVSNRNVRGLQCFYANGSEVSKEYAQSIQTEFNKSVMHVNRNAMVGDYYILECSEYPSVLIECGFLSNLQEEEMLKAAEYQKILAHYIAVSIVKQALYNKIG